MNLPSTLKVGGFTYKIIQNYRFSERSDLLRQADSFLLKIKFSNIDVNGTPLPKDKKREVFFHELLHCIDAVYNAGKLDEDTTVRLGNGLAQVLKDNKLDLK